MREDCAQTTAVESGVGRGQADWKELERRFSLRMERGGYRAGGLTVKSLGRCLRSSCWRQNGLGVAWRVAMWLEFLPLEMWLIMVPPRVHLCSHTWAL